MSLRKLYFFALLAAILTLATIERLNPGVRELALLRLNAQPHDSVLAADESLFRLVQSKNAEGLGAGKLLVASRDLGDPNFAKTVILLVQYDPQGVVGLILNRRTNVPLSKVLDSLKAAKNLSDPVYLGGPVDIPSVFALFKSSAKIEGADRVFGGVYLIHEKTLLEQTISTRPDPGVFHVYLGYAGWTRQQLRAEVELGAWFIFPADVSTVFKTDPDGLWPQMIRQTEMKVVKNEPANADPRKYRHYDR